MKRFLMVLAAVAVFLGIEWIVYALRLPDIVGVSVIFGLIGVIIGIFRGDFDRTPQPEHLEKEITLKSEPSPDREKDGGNGILFVLGAMAVAMVYLGFRVWTQDFEIQSLTRSVQNHPKLESALKRIAALEEFKRSVDDDWRQALENRAAKNEERFVRLEREIESRAVDIEETIPDFEKLSKAVEEIAADVEALKRAARSDKMRRNLDELSR